MMPPLLLAFLGALATLATAGLFYQFGDRFTPVVVELLAAVFWGVFAFGAMDVVVVSDVDPPVTEPIMPLVILGLGLSVLTFMYALYDLVAGAAAEAEAVDLQNVG